MKIYKKILFLLMLSACANPLPPSGGPPDTTPPEVIYTEPANGIANWQGKTILLKFSKYMNKMSVIENLSISPVAKMKYSWSGKEIEIEFEEPLDTNTTYALVLGTDYTDIRNNKPQQSFSLIFSTGPYIDSGSISGKLYDVKPEGAFIFAYKLNNKIPDTINPKTTEPDYRVQVGSSGNFKIPALKDGKYRIFAVLDKFKDGIYNEGIDRFGSAVFDVDVLNSRSPAVLIKLGPTIDSQRPMLYEAEAVSSQRVIAYFSEPIDTLSLNKSLFSITDSSGMKKEEEPKAVYLKPDDSKAIEIILANNLDNQKKYKLLIENTMDYKIRDTAGNPLNDSANFAYFIANNDKENLLPSLYKLPFRDSSNNINPAMSLKIIFNTAIENTEIEKNIVLRQINEEKSIQCEILWQSSNILEIIPKQKLKQDAWHRLVIKIDSVKSLLGTYLKDSTYILNFKTADYRNYGAVSGRISNPSSCDGNYVVMLKSKRGKEELKTMASADGLWNFDEVEPGEWTIQVFCDENGDQNYGYGNAFPFRFAEKFYIFENTIIVKPRWKVEGVVLNIE